MKQFLLSIFLLCCTCINAQEKVSPILNDEIQKMVSIIVVDGQTTYSNVLCTIQSKNHYGKNEVKVRLTDSSGQTLYKTTLKNSYLYIFNDGQIQIGQPTFDKMVIYYSETFKQWLGDINAKQGIWAK